MTAVNWQSILASTHVQTLLDVSLDEDIGTGDITTESVFAEAQTASAHIVTRNAAVMCAGPLASHLFERFELRVDNVAGEGVHLAANAPVMVIRGDVRALLKVERCVLNFLGRLMGIATFTAKAVAQLPRGSASRIFDTRKTTPGWRLLEKAAVRVGGGHNHRQGLFDAVLIKDNHIAAAGSVEAAVRAARAHVGQRQVVEVEIDHLEQLGEALAAGPDIVLLDNFTPAQLTEAVSRVRSHPAHASVQLEASGGVTLETLPALGATGVDRISMGALTHSAPVVDVSLEILP